MPHGPGTAQDADCFYGPLLLLLLLTPVRRLFHRLDTEVYSVRLYRSQLQRVSLLPLSPHCPGTAHNPDLLYQPRLLRSFHCTWTALGLY